MTQTLNTEPAPRPPVRRQRVDAWLAELRVRPARRATSRRPAGLFATESYWRDLVSFTWNITTVEGRDGVADLLERDPRGHRPVRVRDRGAAGRGRRRDHGLDHLRDRGGPRPRAAAAQRGGRRGPGVDAADHALRAQGPRGAAQDRSARWAPSTAPTSERQTWKERQQQEAESLGSTTQPYVLVIGGGQGGIALGARLRQLGVPSLVIDKHPRPGDQWRSRYKSLCLHDPVWYDHLPYLKFPDNWPVFSPKDKIGDWLESYTKVMEVPYWSSTTATSASYSEETGEWTVEVERDGKPLTLRPKAAGARHRHVRQAEHPRPARHGRLPRRPAPLLGPPRARTPTPARSASSSAATTPPSTSAARCGRTTPTSRWCSAPRRTSSRATRLMDIGLGDLYSERAVAAGVTTEKADLIFASLPYRIMHTFQIPLYDADGASATRTSTTGSRRPGSTTTGATTAPGCS